MDIPAWPEGPPQLRLELPISPSTNNLYVERRDGKGRAKTTEYKNWIEEAGWTVAAQKPGRPNYRHVVTLIEAPISYQRDVENFKPVLDLLKTMGILRDDRWVDDYRVVRVPVSQPMAVSIWEIRTSIKPQV